MDRYEKQREAKRNEWIVSFRKRNPGISFAAIGRMLPSLNRGWGAISRQRVQRIWRDYKEEE